MYSLRQNGFLAFMLACAASQVRGQGTSTGSSPRLVMFLRDAEAHYVGLFPQPASATGETPALAVELTDCSSAGAARMLGLPSNQQAELLAENDLKDDNGLTTEQALKCSGVGSASWPGVNSLWWDSAGERYYARFKPGQYLSVPMSCALQVAATGIETLALQGIDEDHFSKPSDMTKETVLGCGRGELEPVEARRPWKIYRYEDSFADGQGAAAVTERRFVAVHTGTNGSRRIITLMSVDGFSYSRIINGRRKNGNGEYLDQQGAMFDNLYNRLFQFFGQATAPRTVPDGAPQDFFQPSQRQAVPELFVALCLDTCASPQPGPKMLALDAVGAPTNVLVPPSGAILRMRRPSVSLA